MFKVQYLLSVSALLFTLNAQADTYLIVEAGQINTDLGTSHFQAFNQSIVGKGGTASLSTKDRNTALMLGAGYQYSPNFALELSYLGLGKVSATSSTSDTNSSGITRTRVIQETAEHQGILLAAVGQYPISQNWSLKGHLGMAWLSQKTTGTASGESVNATGNVVGTDSESNSNTKSEWAPVIGLGGGYQLNPNWQLQLNWRRMVNLDPGVLGKFDVDILSLGAKYQF